MTDPARSHPRADTPEQEPDPAPQSSLRFYGEEFAFDTTTGMFFRLSPTGAFVLRALDAGVKRGELAGVLQDRYGIDRATATRDIELFLNELASLEPLARFANGEDHDARSNS